MPDELTVKALVAAAKRGVAVQIITPGTDIDSDVVRAASRERWGDLLKAGVKIAEYQPTMFHVKALVVDNLLVSVGSTNFDNRSFSLNDEANLNVLDAAVRQVAGRRLQRRLAPHQADHPGGVGSAPVEHQDDGQAGVADRRPAVALANRSQFALCMHTDSG